MCSVVWVTVVLSLAESFFEHGNGAVGDKGGGILDTNVCAVYTFFRF